MANNITPFLTFTGQGRDALELYAAVFPNAEVEQRTEFGPGEDGVEGTLRQAVLKIGKGRVRLIDTPHRTGFHFSSAMSLFVDCDSAQDVDAIAAALSEGGETLMPADTYDFAERFAWVADPFGVNWQLSYGART
jgi:predicted 3-demethylubiquinone-9 3-methyltransferase (glyoxalase superfamily)